MQKLFDEILEKYEEYKERPYSSMNQSDILNRKEVMSDTISVQKV